jgi:hypothetical protein
MRRALTLLLLPALLSACFGSRVRRDYDTSVDFQRLKTYAWQSPTQETPGADLANNSLLDARVRAAVDAVLAEKGYAPAPDDRADFRVAYHYAVEKEAASRGVRTGVGLGLGSRGTFGSVGVGSGGGTDRLETLTLDVLDPVSGKLMWRGLTEKSLDLTADPDESSADILATVREILSKFPPKPRRR